MTTFHEQAARGDAVGALQAAASYAALWAIGSAWSTAIRAISLELFPHATMEVVVAELSAATITTLLAMGLALLASRSTRCCEMRRPNATTATTSSLTAPQATLRSQTLASRA